MDTKQFGTLMHTMSSFPSRREVLRGLAGTGLGLGIARIPDHVEAKKKRKRKRKKRQPVGTPNEYGCLEVNAPCRSAEQCCSGVCEGTKPKKGKPDKSRCVAHDTRICTDGFDLCTTGIGHICDASAQCACLLTTGNAPFCGDFREYSAYELCRECRQDSDCQDEFGPGAACVVLEGICEEYCPDTGNLACIPACTDTVG